MSLMKRYKGLSSRARQQAGGSGEENDWLATYGDLMSLLLVFFVLFYIFSVTGQLPLLSEALEAYQQEKVHTGDITASRLDDASQISEGETIISIPSQVLYDLGQSDLKEAAVPYLENAVDSLKTILSADPNAQIRIEGYTDNIPIHNWRFRDNWELSAMRAISVVKYLIENHQFDPTRLQAMGYGEYNPVATNDTPLNRQKNRRVEIKVVKGNGSIPESLPIRPQVGPSQRERAASEAASKLLGKDSEN